MSTAIRAITTSSFAIITKRRPTLEATGHVQVARTATKPQIKEAVEKLFDVKVKSVTRWSARAAQGFRGRLGEQSDVKKRS